MKRTKRNRVLSLILCGALVLGQMGTTAYAENDTDIGSRDGLCEHHTQHDEACGYVAGHPCEHQHTDECYELVTKCPYVIDEDAIEDDASPSNAASPSNGEPVGHVCSIESGCVTKMLNCPHDKGIHNDTCGFVEAKSCQYECDICNPQNNDLINNSLAGNRLTEKIITEWEWIDPDGMLNHGVLALPGVNAENPADFDTVVSMLPKKVTAFVAGTTTGNDAGEQMDITLTGWTCEPYKQDDTGAWPLTGEYLFTNDLPEGYALADGAERLEITVTVGEGNTLDEETGDFTVTGENLIATDYEYDSTTHTLTIKTSKNITISMKSGVSKTEQDHIVVDGSCTDTNAANITLNGVDIQFNDGTYYENGTCAFEVAGNATCNLTLTGTNTLKSGHRKAGLQVQDKDNAKATLNITAVSTGELTTSGVTYGAGIGGGRDGAGGTITISGGTVTATSKDFGGAGIGGGFGGAAGTITISGGTVNVTGSGGGAGIGGSGYKGAAGTITIKGGTVNAKSNNGAGIGCGEGGNGGTVTIKGGTVTAEGATAIGGGNKSNTTSSSIEAITISGGTVTAIGNIGGGYDCDSGNITITGGTVSATGCIGAPDYYGKAKTIIISGGTVSTNSYIGGGMWGGQSGSFSTTAPDGTPGNAVITASQIKNKNNQYRWSGIVFQTDTDKGDGNGQVYGSPTLKCDLEIPAGKTLSIPSGASLTIADDVTLTDNGTITVSSGGSLTNKGTIIVAENCALTVEEDGVLNNIGGTLSGNGRIPDNYNTYPSTVTLTVSPDSIAYGDTLTLTATIAQKEISAQASNAARLRSFPQKTVIFYRDDTEIGSAIVSGKTAVLTLNNLTWMPGKYTLTASYMGGDDRLLPSESSGVSLTVNKARPEAPSVTTNYADETFSTTTDMQYSTDNGTSWNDCTANMTVTDLGWDGTEKAVQFRTKETDTAEASEAQAITILARPDAPTLTLDADNESVIISNEYYYGTTGNSYTSITTQGDGNSVPVLPGTSIYIYKAAVTTPGQEAFKSAIQTLTAPGRAETPTVTIDYAGETLSTTTDMQYSTGNGTDWTDWTDCGESNMTITSFDGWDGTEQKVVRFRTKATAGNYASEPTTALTLPARPGAPTLTLDNITESVTISGEYYYGTTDGSYDSITTRGTGDPVTVSGGSIYICKTETDSTFKSAVQTLTAPGRGTIPSVTIDYAGETLSSATDMQYKVENGDWADCTEANMTITSLGWDGTEKTVQFRTKATDTAYASEPQTLAVPARPAAPDVQGVNETIRGLNNGKITDVTTAMEYKLLTSDRWITCNGTTITGLTPGSYLVRLKAVTDGDNRVFAGTPANVTIGTDAERSYALNITAPTFAPVTAGYTGQEAKAVTITSSGNMDTDISSVTLSGTDAESFILNKTDGTTIAAGAADNTTYTVQPTDGLAAGTYTTTITVTYNDGAAATAPVSFTVNARSSSSSGSGDRDNSSAATTTPPSKESTVPTVGTITTNPDEPLTGDQIINALNQAAAAARAKGGSGSGNGLAVSATLPGGMTSVVLNRDALEQLMNSGAGYFKVNFGDVLSMTFTLDNLKKLAEQTTGAVTFTAAKAAVTGGALAAIGTRPTYNLGISCQKDGQTVNLTAIGSLAVTISYTPAVGESDGALYAVYVNGASPEWLTLSSYSKTVKGVLFTADHLGTYGIGYKTPLIFSDTINHLAQSDIDFAAIRGLIPGTSDTTFSPDSPMTREELTAILQQHGIRNDKGANPFGPRATVPRAEAAAILRRYMELAIDPIIAGN